MKELWKRYSYDVQLFLAVAGFGLCLFIIMLGIS